VVALDKNKIKKMGLLKTSAEFTEFVGRNWFFFSCTCTMFGLKLLEMTSFDVSQPAGGFQKQLQSTKCKTKSIRGGTVCLSTKQT
jgi:hypothetical protein